MYAGNSIYDTTYLSSLTYPALWLLMKLLLHRASSNYYQVLKLQVSDGVIRCVLFSESITVICQSQEGEGGFGGLVNRAFFWSVVFCLSKVESDTCPHAHRVFIRWPWQAIVGNSTDPAWVMR